ncbi:PC3-like endoprotease variant B [Asterias rubens]|uniref:PC3-like endoprotease variant B n=1 Tax=Asterias rubens TaxID=7604 RepID=UPI0014556283|nr:PC3-like endoprotease variant B [Asterias rubens]
MIYIQHIVVHGSHIPNVEESGWHINGAGFHTNEKFGFGMLDAGKMVELALTWRLVGPQQTYSTTTSRYHKSILQGMSTVVYIDINCPITKLEHTIAKISYQAPRRGDVSLTIWSPQGTPPSSSRPLPDIPRGSSKVARFTSFQLVLYGTNDDADLTTTNEENPAVNPDLSGHIEDNVVVDLYNKEQLDDEEIVIDKDNLAKGVEEPPNTKHNLDDEKDIDSGEFDGILKDPQVRALYISKRAEMRRRFEERKETRRNEFDDLMTNRGQEERSHDQEIRSHGQVRSHELDELRKDTIKESQRLLKERDIRY